MLWNRFASSSANYPISSGATGINLPPTGGLVQRVNGLTNGVEYEISFSRQFAGGEPVYITIANNTTQYANNTFNSGTAGIKSWTFIANASECTILIMGIGASTSTTTNWHFRNTVSNSTPTGQVLVDLFDEKQIPLTLSVDNFQNAAEKTQSYSKAFKLPGTDRNNKILRNIYDITGHIAPGSVDFNPYLKTRTILQENGSTIFEGFMRLLNIGFKDDNIIYNVNLYSQTVQIKDILKDRKFYDLDFSELEHLYVKSTIKSSWDNTPGLLLRNPLPVNSFAGPTGAMNTTVLKYPFVDWSHGSTVANNPGAPPLPGPADGMPEFASLGQVFRPWISITYCLQKIFAEAGFTFTSSFLSSVDSKNLYMDFNWGANRAPMQGGTFGLSEWKHSSSTGSFFASNVVWTNIPLRSYFGWGGISIIIPGYNQNTNVFTTQNSFTNLQWNTSAVKWENTSGVDIVIILETIKNGGLNPYDTVSATFTAFANTVATYNPPNTFWPELMLGDTVEQRWITQDPLASPTAVRIWEGGVAVETNIIAQTVNVVSSTVLQTKRGKLGQWEFLKGLLDMFNLLTVEDPTNSQNIIIEPYDVIFPPIGPGGGSVDLASRGITLDWTDKVDTKDINLKPLTKLKKITNFEYQEDNNDYTFQNYKNALGGYLYGSQVFDASGLTLIVGTGKVSAKPFAATLNKPFAGTVPDLWTPAIYKLKDDGTTEEFDNKPRILYDNGRVTQSQGTFYIPSANGESSENANTYLQFSGFSQIPITPTTRDLNFGTCQLIGENNNTALTLYNRFYSKYYGDLYNPDTRIVKLKINLNAADINQFSFSDIVMVKNRAYRINKIDYNPGQLAKVELILIP